MNSKIVLIKMCKCVLFILSSFTIYNKNTFAQENEGSLVIYPISQFSLNKDTEDISIVNTSNENRYFLYEENCNINNIEYTGTKCKEFFKFDISDILDKDIITIPANSQIEKTVYLISKPKDSNPFYALFKPIFTILPKDYKDNKKSVVAFYFKYAPGALFIWNPKEEDILLTSFTTSISQKKVRSVTFEFDISKLKQAQITTINAKIIDRKSKKMIRFIDLGKEKIVDPKRNKFIRSAELDEEIGDSNTLCYELFIQNVLTNKVYKIASKNCE